AGEGQRRPGRSAGRDVHGVPPLQAGRVGAVLRDRLRLGRGGVPGHNAVGPGRDGKRRERQAEVGSMCGIAGIIHRDGTGDIGAEVTRMLQSMKHRGPDSSGFALYGPPSDLLVMRLKLADPNEARGFGWSDRLERHRDEVEHRLAKIGAMVDVIHGDQEYAYRVTFRY